VAVTSLTVTERDLVLATHGRSSWVLDDPAPLRQWTESAAAEPLHVFSPVDAVRRVYPADLDGDERPTAAQYGVFEELSAQLQGHLARSRYSAPC
jgi:hypothetical protein